MSTTILRSAEAILATTLAWAAIAKAARPSRWTDAVRGYAVPRWMFARVVVPLAEAAIVVAFLSGRSRLGALAAATLLVVFSLVVLRARAVRGDRLPCGCFGGRKVRDYRAMLGRNLLLLLLAVVVLVGGRDVTMFPEDLARADLVPLGLVIGGFGLGAWVVSQVPTDLDAERS